MADERLENWRRCWRAAAGVLARNELEALRAGLLLDDRCLLQGATTEPPPLMVCQDWPVEACCPLAYAGWQCGLTTVAEVEEFFARVCHEIDEALGEPAGCRWLLNWIDETPRAAMIAALLPEVETALAKPDAMKGTSDGSNG